MRIPSGVTDQYIYFVGVSPADFVSRQTGMAGKFSVYRSRNGAAATAMTTPTINEVDSTNMPGVYELLLDEDMSVAAGNYSEEMAFHITTTDTALSTDSIAPVTRTIELYNDRMDTATGQGAAIISTQATHSNQLSTATTGINDTQNKSATATTGINSVQATQTSHSASLSTATTGVNDLQDKAITATTGINSLETSVAALEVSVTYATGGIDQLQLDTANLESGLDFATDAISALSTGGGQTADLVETVDTVVDTLRVSMDSATERIHYLSTGGGPFPGGGGLTAGEIADAVWDEAQADHESAGSFGVLYNLATDTNARITAGAAGATATEIANAVMNQTLADHTNAAQFAGGVQNKLSTATAGVNDLQTGVAGLETGLDFATDAISALSTGGGHTADLVETVDTVVDGLRVSMDFATERVSYLSTGGGIAADGGTVPTATEVANAVMGQTSADHTGAGTFAGDVFGMLQSSTDSISALSTGGGQAANLVESLTTDVSAIETSVTFATKGIDQTLTGLGTATDVLSALATGGGAAAAPSVSDILTTQMTEAYAADGTAPTLAQALFLIQQQLGDFSISGTTLTVRQLDGSTTAATFTLNDGTSPTSLTRSG